MKDKDDVVKVIIKTSYGEYMVKVGAKNLEELKDMVRRWIDKAMRIELTEIESISRQVP